jgi:DNA-binding winged helix-turn-helix (wHTH) protein
MTPEPRTPAILQFGVFEVDLHARELYKQGVRLKLQEQPFRVLTVLLQRFGEVVSREELRTQIWPEDTFVDFDANLNTSINKLREALGDSAENPRFIETLPRRGYRFITPVTAGVGTARAPFAKASAGVPASVLKIAPPITRHRILPWIIAAAGVLVAVVVGLGRWRSNPPVEQPLVRLDVDLGAQITLPAPAINGSSVIISPDGTRLVFVASVAGGRPKLFTRKLDQPNVTELAGTEEASAPFFSADGQSVGFSANNKLNKISVKGGEVVPLMDVAYFAGGSWSEAGDIIVGRAMKEGMARISSSGGAPTALTELASGEGFHGSPQILPGGRALLFVAGALGNPDKNTIEVASLADRRRKTLVRGAANPLYLPSNHLIYVRKGTLFAIPFDLARLEVHGAAVPVLDQVAYNAITDAAQFDLSHNGTLVYRRAGGAPRKSTVQWLEATGKKEPLLAKPGEYKEPRLSPDGKRLGPGGDRSRAVRHLGLRLAARHHDAVDVRRWTVW